ncbi:MAG: sensor histidine kinase [Candidatus Hodarchaeales archaeon]|jgi:signal transduction histidine kinase
MILAHNFYAKYREIIQGAIMGALIAVIDLFIDYYVEDQQKPVTDYFAEHLDIFGRHTIEHIFFLALGLLIGAIWWKTGNQYRELFRLRQELGQRYQFIELLLDIMTHDISNYYQIALANLQLIEELKEVDDEIDEFVAGLRRAVTHSAMLTTNVKELDRLQSQELELESVDLRPMIKSAREKVEKMYPSIPFEVDITTDNEKVVVLGHPILENVFINLMTNAFRYRKSDQEEIKIEIEMKSGPEGVFIQFGDHGIGIEDTRKEEIFSRFGTSKEKRGSGVGLSISKRIIESFQGKIWVENRPESPNDHLAGSLFIIFFTKQKGS